jgi:hypothetical protein
MGALPSAPLPHQYRRGSTTWAWKMLCTRERALTFGGPRRRVQICRGPEWHRQLFICPTHLVSQHGASLASYCLITVGRPAIPSARRRSQHAADRFSGDWSDSNSGPVKRAKEDHFVSIAIRQPLRENSTQPSISQRLRSLKGAEQAFDLYMAFKIISSATRIAFRLSGIDGSVLKNHFIASYREQKGRQSAACHQPSVGRLRHNWNNYSINFDSDMDSSVIA